MCFRFCKGFLGRFHNFCNPVPQIADGAADGIHHAVSRLNIPVEIADVGFNALAFQSANGCSHVDGRNLIQSLPLIGAHIYSLRTSGKFQILILNNLPAVPPFLGMVLLIPVNGILLVAFPVAGGKSDTLSVFVKVINLAALRQPLSVFVNGSHGQHDMAMGIVSGRIGVMNCKITAHSLGHKMLLAVFLHHLRIHFGRDFSRQGKNESSGKLRVPLFFHFLDSVPERCPVGVFRRGICRKHDFRVKNLRLFSSMVFGFLVVLGEQFFSCLVGSSGNSRATLASLDDADFQMWYWHFGLNLLSMVQKKTDTFQYGRGGIFTCCRGMIACNRSSAASLQRGSWQSQRRGSVASSG